MWPLSSILAIAAIVLAALALLDVVAATSGLALAVIVLAVGQLIGSGAFRIGR
ncbi:MAG: hypothetical protein HY682_06450 [Chloroflexi bacterium]|nr:hypothetical protein [Chloroflexota bacterium]